MVLSRLTSRTDLKAVMPRRSFTILSEIDAITRINEHGGSNQIAFRRLCSESDFDSPIDFIDFTVIPSQSTIGWHAHQGNEEAYFIAAGRPLMRVQDEVRRLTKGDLSVVRSGESHELINDTDEDVEILVFQVRLPSSEPPQ